MRALIVVRGIDARPDQRQCHVPTCAPAGLAVGAVVGVDVGFVGNRISLGQLSQAIAEATMIRPAAALQAERGVKLVRLLPCLDRRHVHREQFLHIRGDACRRAVAYFPVVKHV